MSHSVHNPWWMPGEKEIDESHLGKEHLFYMDKRNENAEKRLMAQQASKYNENKMNAIMVDFILFNFESSTFLLLNVCADDDDGDGNNNNNNNNIGNNNSSELS